MRSLLGLAISAAGNALTVALKHANGGDPDSGGPVSLSFRDATGSTGTPQILNIEAASSFVISAGSTMGVVGNNVPFRLWFVAFNDAGTMRLGAINCRSGFHIMPLSEDEFASSTAEGGAGGADSAQTFYTGAAVTNKPYVILGYAEWSSGLSTIGTWASGPTKVQLFGEGVPLPGSVIQTKPAYKSDTLTTAVTSFTDISGLSLSLNVKGCANAVYLKADLIGSDGGVEGRGGIRFVRGSTAIGVGDTASSRTPVSFNVGGTKGVFSMSAAGGAWTDFPGAAGATTYKLQIITDASTIYLNRSSQDSDSAAYLRTVCSLSAMEIMG